MSNKIWITSDLHFNHNKEFLYKPRGFDSITEMNDFIISNWNKVVDINDHVYILGDLMFQGCDDKNRDGLYLLQQLHGLLHLVRGNHDTNKRWNEYSLYLNNVIEQENAIYLNYRKYHFYLSHFPTLTGNLQKESIKQMTINLFGHTHSKDHFYEDTPYMYNVAMDAHNCMPVPLDQIIEEIREKYKNTEKPETKEIIIPRCDKCVYDFISCHDTDVEGNCRTYKRDPPDGGYYG